MYPARSSLARSLGVMVLVTLSVGGCWTRALPVVGGTGATTGSPGSGGSTMTYPDGGLPLPRDAGGTVTTAEKLDVLFLIDNSQSMAPLQAKMRAQIPAFIDTLVDPVTGHLPQLHVAVISSSFAAGAWGNVNQCGAGSHPGDDQGFFRQGPGAPGSGSCPMLAPGATFLDTGDGVTTGANFTGDIRDAFACTANLGDDGCGFESQFASTYYALYYASLSHAESPANGGFLRPDARLAIVMITNEDDCSVSGESLLLAPSVNSVSDPTGLGALWSYRCNEFGHLCNGQPPPHAAPGTEGVTLTNCVSAENMGKTDPLLRDPTGAPDPTMGHLWPTVGEFQQYLKALKSNPNDVFIAAIAGPPTPYRVVPRVNAAAMNEVDPAVEHSCTMSTTGDSEYADPAVRIKQLVDGFGANGVFYPICAANFAPSMTGIASAIHLRLGN